MPTTMREVAKRAGVSLKTVSRVVNGEVKVSPQTKAKILDVIRQLDFAPNLAARRLSHGKAMAIGLVLGWSLNSTYSSAMTDFIFKSCKEQGYSLVLFSNDENLESQVLQACLGKQVDGIILDTIVGQRDELRTQLDSFQIPYVVVHPSSNDGTYTCAHVTIDDHQSAKVAVEYLIQLGHRSIGCIVEKSGLSQERDRLSGYQQALAEAGIGYREELVSVNTNRGFQAGFSSASQLLANCDDLSAIFCATDEIAMGAMSTIWQQGRKIPNDISVIGFDDIRYAAMIVPPLTTIRQPIDQIAELVVKYLIDKIKDPAIAPIHQILPTSLIVRETCSPFCEKR